MKFFVYFCNRIQRKGYIKRMLKNIRNWIGIVVFLLALAACSTIDCPLNRHVGTICKFAGDVVPLPDELTVSIIDIDGDSVSYNHAAGLDSIVLPISYNRAEDVLYFMRSNATGLSLTDTVVVEKQDIPHFESIDCNPSYFHVIKRVRHTRLGIDSIIINKEKVTYDASKPHLLIYFKNFYQ